MTLTMMKSYVYAHGHELPAPSISNTARAEDDVDDQTFYNNATGSNRNARMYADMDMVNYGYTVAAAANRETAAGHREEQELHHRQHHPYEDSENVDVEDHLAQRTWYQHRRRPVEFEIDPYHYDANHFFPAHPAPEESAGALDAPASEDDRAWPLYVPSRQLADGLLTKPPPPDAHTIWLEHSFLKLEHESEWILSQPQAVKQATFVWLTELLPPVMDAVARRLFGHGVFENKFYHTKTSFMRGGAWSSYRGSTSTKAGAGAGRGPVSVVERMGKHVAELKERRWNPEAGVVGPGAQPGGAAAGGAAAAGNTKAKGKGMGNKRSDEGAATALFGRPRPERPVAAPSLRIFPLLRQKEDAETRGEDINKKHLVGRDLAYSKKKSLVRGLQQEQPAFLKRDLLDKEIDKKLAASLACLSLATLAANRTASEQELQEPQELHCHEPPNHKPTADRKPPRLVPDYLKAAIRSLTEMKQRRSISSLFDSMWINPFMPVVSAYLKKAAISFATTLETTQVYRVVPAGSNSGATTGGMPPVPSVYNSVSASGDITLKLFGVPEGLRHRIGNMRRERDDIVYLSVPPTKLPGHTGVILQRGSALSCPTARELAAREYRWHKKRLDSNGSWSTLILSVLHRRDHDEVLPDPSTARAARLLTRAADIDFLQRQRNVDAANAGNNLPPPPIGAGVAGVVGAPNRPLANHRGTTGTNSSPPLLANFEYDTGFLTTPGAWREALLETFCRDTVRRKIYRTKLQDYLAEGAGGSLEDEREMDVERGHAEAERDETERQQLLREQEDGKIAQELDLVGEMLQAARERFYAHTKVLADLYGLLLLDFYWPGEGREAKSARVQVLIENLRSIVLFLDKYHEETSEMPF
eukprot:g6978.t1